LRQLARHILLCHHGQGEPFDLAALAFAAEFQVALLAHGLGGLSGGFEPFARIELVGFSAMNLRTAPVMAKRMSVSMLILRTPYLMASWISLIGTPYVSFILPRTG
jgi:hypothetical protein